MPLTYHLGGNRAVVSGETQRFRPSSNLRPYWWFLAVADCSVDTLDIESYEYCLF